MMICQKFQKKNTFLERSLKEAQNMVILQHIKIAKSQGNELFLTIKQTFFAGHDPNLERKNGTKKFFYCLLRGNSPTLFKRKNLQKKYMFQIKLHSSRKYNWRQVYTAMQSLYSKIKNKTCFQITQKKNQRKIKKNQKIE